MAAALAGGGAVMLFLGEPFDAASEFAGELYSEAGRYGAYADCFVDGALQAFSTYAQEVEAARWLGIASTFVDIPNLLNNNYWLGNRQLTAMAAFNYRTPGPIFTSENLLRHLGGDYRFVVVGKRKIGVDERGQVRLYYLGSEEGVLRLFPRSVLTVEEYVGVDSEGEDLWELVRVYDAQKGEHLLAARIVSGGRAVVYGYNDALVAGAVGRACSGVVYRGGDVVIGGRVFKTYVIDFDSSVVDRMVTMRETGVKYLMASVVSGLYGVDPRMLGIEVGLPSGFNVVRAGQYGTLLGLSPLDEGLQIYVGEGPRPDLLGVLPDGRLLWVEVKNLDRLSTYPPSPNDLDYWTLRSEFLAVSDRARHLLGLIRKEGASRVSAALASSISAFAGAGASGGGVSSAFVFDPVFVLPELSGRSTRISFVLVLFRSGRIVMYNAEVSLGDLANRDFLGRLFDDAVAVFGSVDKREQVAALGALVEEYVQRLPLPR
jgi:hypothetical protein